MESDQPPAPEGNPNPPSHPEGPAVFSQQFHNQPVAARVPEKLARGVMTTGVLVQDGAHEFVLDFLQVLSQPKQIAARVVLAPGVMDSLVRTLGDSLNRYVQTFGPPAPLPRPPQPAKPPSIQEIYENFKLPEDQWSGVYANSVLIGHAPAEFFMDFITGFYPTAAVSCRVFFAAQQAPRYLETLRAAMQRYHQRRMGLGGPGQHQQPFVQPPAPPPQQQQEPPETQNG